MAFKTVVNSLQELAESLREHYRPGTAAEGAEGKFVAEAEAVEGFDMALEPVNGLRTSLATERKRAEELDRQLKHVGKTIKVGEEVYDEGRIAALFTEVEKLRAAGGDPDDKIATIKQSLEKQYASRETEITAKFSGDIKTLEAKLEQAGTSMRNSVVRSEVTKALNAHKGNVTILEPHVMQRVQAVADGDTVHLSIVDDHGNAMISRKPGATDNMSVMEFVEGLKTHKDFGNCFEGSGGSGTGGSGGRGGGSSNHDKYANIKDPQARLAAMRADEVNN